MKQLVKTYFSLVKSALWEEPVQWPSAQSDPLLRINAMQGTGALVYPSALANSELTVSAHMQMKAYCLSTMQQQVQLRHTLGIAWDAMWKAGIRPVLMKGAGLAAFYPDPQCRAWGDIDLFVGVDQYHPACAAMRETFPNALKFDEELDHYKHYNLIADGISIEVHRVSVGFQHPVDARRYAEMEAFGMNNACPITIEGLEVLIPEPTFNALFVMLHSWEHMMTKGANVRQICDLTLLLHHYADRIDIPRLKGYLNDLHLMDVWQLFMWIAVHGLGLPENEAPFYTNNVADRAERLIDDMISGKLTDTVSDTKEAAPKNRFARKFHTMKGRLRNADRIAQYSPDYAKHMKAETLLHGVSRLFAKDRHWE